MDAEQETFRKLAFGVPVSVVGGFGIFADMDGIPGPRGYTVYSRLGGGADPVPYGSLVFVKALPPHEVIPRLGAACGSVRSMTDEERVNQGGAEDLLSVRVLGGAWTLAFESGGFGTSAVRRLA